MEEGGSLVVIYQRTEEENPTVISCGPEQILRYRSDEVVQVWWCNYQRVPREYLTEAVQRVPY